MKYKSSKRKKRCKSDKHRSWLQDFGSFLVGLAAVLKVILEFVIWLLTK